MTTGRINQGAFLFYRGLLFIAPCAPTFAGCDARDLCILLALCTRFLSSLSALSSSDSLRQVSVLAESLSNFGVKPFTLFVVVHLARNVDVRK